MKKRFVISLFAILCSFGTARSQERINEFMVNADETHNPMTIYSSYGATPNDGVVIVNSTMPDLEFNIPAAPGRIKTVPDKKKNRYVLIIQPNDSNYKQYTITINAKGFKQGKINAVVVKAGLSSGYTVNPKYGSQINVDPLYVDGWAVYRNGKELSNNEVRALFANTESYDLYMTGLKKKEGGSFEKVMTGIGLGAFAGGSVLACTGLLIEDYSISKIGLWIMGGGTAVWLSELVVLRITPSIGKKQIQKAVDLYNNRNMRSQNGIELEYGLTGNGVYFSLLF